MLKRIAHITDLHLDEEFTAKNGADARANWERILKDVQAKGVDEVVFGGDIGTGESNRWFFDRMKACGLNYRIVLGNHDEFSHTTRHYHPSDPEREALYYSDDEDPDYKFLYLDTSLNEIRSAQLQWLRDELHSLKKIILFIHHPVLNTGTTPQREYPLKGSEAIKGALLGIKNEVYIFCGHLHLQDQYGEENITQFVTPAASYQLKGYSDKTEVDSIRYGYRIIDITNQNLATSVIMLDQAEV